MSATEKLDLPARYRRHPETIRGRRRNQPLPDGHGLVVDQDHRKVGGKLTWIGRCQVILPEDLTLLLLRTAILCPSLLEPNSAFVRMARAEFHHGYGSGIFARLESREDRAGPNRQQGPGIGPKGSRSGDRGNGCRGSAPGDRAAGIGDRPQGSRCGDRAAGIAQRGSGAGDRVPGIGQRESAPGGPGRRDWP